jgi:hypothetical protein
MLPNYDNSTAQSTTKVIGNASNQPLFAAAGSS